MLTCEMILDFLNTVALTARQTLIKFSVFLRLYGSQQGPASTISSFVFSKKETHTGLEQHEGE